MRSLLEAMRRNPVNDWTIADVLRVRGEHGVSCRPPSGGGSHYKVEHPTVPDILTVPFRRPIRPFYIRSLVRFIDAVLMSSSGERS